MNDNFDLYSKKVMKYFKNPKNIGVIKNADGIGTVGNPRCGDVMKVYLKIGRRSISESTKSQSPNSKQIPNSNVQNPKKLKSYFSTTLEAGKLQASEEYIKDIKVQTLGCGAAIATSSIATEMVKGKSLDEALKITNQDVAKALGGLPPTKMHCSLLAQDGIQKAIEDYKSRICRHNRPDFCPRQEKLPR